MILERQSSHREIVCGGSEEAGEGPASVMQLSHPLFLCF